MKTNDLDIYIHELKFDNIICPELSTSKFQYHIVTIVVYSENGCSVNLLDRFIYYIQKIVNDKNFKIIFNENVINNIGINKKNIEIHI